MDLTPERRSVQRADLDRRMRDEVELEGILADRVPDWYGTLLSSIILAAGDAHVLYLSASFVVDGSAFSTVVALFTQKLYIHATVSGDEGQAGSEPVVTAVPRSSLTSMHVSSDCDIFDDDGAPWPGTIRLVLMFRGDRSVALPLAASGSAAAGAELHSLVDTSRGTLEQTA